MNRQIANIVATTFLGLVLGTAVGYAVHAMNHQFDTFWNWVTENYYRADFFIWAGIGVVAANALVFLFKRRRT